MMTPAKAGKLHLTTSIDGDGELLNERIKTNGPHLTPLSPVGPLQQTPSPPRPVSSRPFTSGQGGLGVRLFAHSESQQS